MKKIALCVFTYEHPETIDEVLENCIEYYYEYGIDIYYYDASKDLKTQEVIKKYREKGFDNIYHIHLPENDERAEMAFRGEFLKKEYDYIWPSKDRSFCSKDVLEKIIMTLEDEHDVVLIGCLLNREDQKILYDDPVQFYCDWAWIATSIDTVIYNKKTMLAGFKKWKITIPFNWFYTFLFQKLAEMPKTDICVLAGKNMQILCSKKSASGWIPQVFEVWKDLWIEANDALPACYESYKAKVLKETASLPWILGGVRRLVELHEMGILVPQKLDAIKINWERVSDVPFDVVAAIAEDNFDAGHDMRLLKSNNEFTNLLAKVIRMLQEGKMKVEQIPLPDIMIKMLDELSKSGTEESNRYLCEGSLSDICEFIEAGNYTEQDVAKFLQICLNFLILAKRI